MNINVSIDDISPHPHSSTQCLNHCFDIISHFPFAKFTLFIPTAYMRIGENPYDIRQYSNFVKEIKSLPREHFEIGYHGHFHANLLRKKNRGEFSGIDYITCIEKIRLSQVIFKECGIDVQPIFRPPGFGLYPDGFQACRDAGIKILCLYPAQPYLRAYGGEEKKFDKVVYVDCHPRPKSDWEPPPEEKLVKKENLSIMYHALEYDKNYFSDKLKKDFLLFIEKENVKFKFMKDL